MLVALAIVGALALMVVSTLFALSHFGVFGFEIEHQPARKCAACDEWFVVPNERETMCFYCIGGQMQEEMEK
jgi:hypothetical protein